MFKPEEITTTYLRELDVFRDLSDEGLAWLLAAGRLRQITPRQPWGAPDDGLAERYGFVLRGILAITQRPATWSPQAVRQKGSKRPPKEQKFLGYFEAGACVSSAFAQTGGLDAASKIDCAALNAVTLLELDAERLQALLGREPLWRRRVAESVAASRRHFLLHQDPARRQVQDFFLRENYVTSSVVRVGRLDLCLDCNKCYDACAERHGAARMARVGPTLGRLTFPVVCRTCTEQSCVPVCKHSAIAFNEAMGEVQISDGCVGCGLCAKNCPNDAITMVPLKEREDGAKGPKKRAVKCDRCAGYDDRACMSACPTGALIEIVPSELFSKGPAAATPSAVHFSEAAFLRRLPAPDPRHKRLDVLKNWATAVTVALLAWLGIESFLIRTQPEKSLLQYVVQATGSSFPVVFASGRGIGHWFGYIGVTLMLASVLYSLRRRIARFEGWGSKSGWLSAHLWLGFVGATLVTYHAAFKLDRWASIACYLMWLVIVTGAVGRYVYGWAKSAANLAEFELNALREHCETCAKGSATPGAIASLIGPDLSSRERSWTVTVMFWEELRDRFALLWLRAFGTGHLKTRAERREMVRGFAEWAAQRRRFCYFESAKPLLAHWSLVHIVLAILMFVLAMLHVGYGFVYKAV